MTQPKQPFINHASQADRYVVLVNDKRAHKNTMLSHTHPGEEMGGRYAAEAKHTIIGDNPIPKYTHAAFCFETQLPDEPPLGYAIDDQEPVGTLQEIEASLKGDGLSPVACDAAAISTVASSEGPQHPVPHYPVGGGAGEENSDPLSSLRRSSPNQFKRRV